MPAQDSPGGDEWDEPEWDDKQDWNIPEEWLGEPDAPEDDPDLKRLTEEFAKEASLDQLIKDLKSGYHYSEEEEL